MWESSISSRFRSSTFTTPTPFTSSPTSFRFIRYNKHTQENKKVSPFHLSHYNRFRGKCRLSLLSVFITIFWISFPEFFLDFGFCFCTTTWPLWYKNRKPKSKRELNFKWITQIFFPITQDTVVLVSNTCWFSDCVVCCCIVTWSRRSRVPPVMIVDDKEINAVRTTEFLYLRRLCVNCDCTMYEYCLWLLYCDCSCCFANVVRFANLLSYAIWHDWLLFVRITLFVIVVPFANFVLFVIWSHLWLCSISEFCSTCDCVPFVIVIYLRMLGGSWYLWYMCDLTEPR